MKFKPGDKVVLVALENSKEHVNIVVGYSSIHLSSVIIEKEGSAPRSFDESYLAIYKEPKVFKNYLHVYKDGEGQSWKAKHPRGVGCIEIVTDEDGKLISAKNV